MTSETPSLSSVANHHAADQPSVVPPRVGGLMISCFVANHIRSHSHVKIDWRTGPAQLNHRVSHIRVCGVAGEVDLELLYHAASRNHRNDMSAQWLNCRAM